VRIPALAGISAFFVAAMAVTGTLAPAAQLSPHEVKQLIADRGPSAVLHDVYSDDKRWQPLLRGIASGSVAWLEIAESLRTVSDGAASEELTLAVGEALASAPAAVLSRATGPFHLSEVCSGPDVDDARWQTYESAEAELVRRIHVVEGVSDQTLRQVRDDCVASLRASDDGLKSFFGKK